METTNNSKRNYLLFICIASAIGGLLFGVDMLVVGGTISHVNKQFNLTEIQSGWFVSSASVGCFVGALSSGTISDKLGRKKPLIIAALIAVVSVVGCVCANNFILLTFSRFFGALGIGIAMMVSPLYISEMSPAKHRGKLTSLFQLAITIGIVCAISSNAVVLYYSKILQSSVDVDQTSFFYRIFGDEIWRGMFSIQIFPSIIFLIFCYFFPESPRWLLKRGREDEARVIFSKVMNDSEVDTVVEETKSIMEEENRGTYKELFVHTGKRRALFIALFLSVVSQCSGITAVFYYGSNMIEKAMGQGAALNGFTVIAIVNVIFTVGSIIFIDKLGRKKLLFVGTVGCVSALILLGIFIGQPNVSGVLLVAIFAFFVAAFAVAIGGVKFTVASEIFPTSVRARAMGITTAALFVPDMIINFLVPIFMKHFGTGSLFIVFAIILSTQFWFIWKIMPETANRTLEEIEADILKRK